MKTKNNNTNQDALDNFKQHVDAVIYKAKEKQDSITKSKLLEVLDKKKKLGMQSQGLIDPKEPELGEAFYCKECGDYDTCDCSGYNECLEDIKKELEL